MNEKNMNRAEEVRKRLLDTADALLQRINAQADNLSVAGVEVIIRAAATAFTAAMAQPVAVDPPPIGGRLPAPVDPPPIGGKQGST
jgi:hypothetical protein